MNWNEIKEKYPKVYRLAKMWWIDEADLSQFEPFELNEGINVNFRYLYDFFDEQKIIIDIGYHRLSMYSFMIFDNDSIVFGRDDNPELGYLTRTEAEQAAFEKAFEILESKL